MPNALSPNSKWDIRFLNLAAHVSAWSKDPSTKVASVIVDSQKRIVSIGFNGSPRGVSDVEDRPRKLMRTVHAEANALHFASKDVAGCTIYITHPPCANCASHIIQRGISEVVFPTPSEDFLSRWSENYNEALSMFGEAGVNVKEYYL